MSKVQHLSQYQKQQYTQYLETQLEKFSAFMLAQKKENQNHLQFQQLIDRQDHQISSLTDRIKVLELYQRENFKHCERLESSNVNVVHFDQRLKKVQSVYFQQSRLREKQNISQWENQNHDAQIQCDLIERYESLRKSVDKKIRSIQKEISALHCMYEECSVRKSEGRTVTAHSEAPTYNSIPTEILATKKEVRIIEDRLFEYFGKKFNKIQKIVKKSSRSQKEKSNSNITTNMLVQEQTFGVDEYFNEEQVPNSQIRNSQNKSYSISDTSTHLKPVKYFSQKAIERESEERKKSLRRKRSRSKSQHKEHIKSKQRSLSRSKSVSKSKSRSKNESRVKKSGVRKQERSPYNRKERSLQNRKECCPYNGKEYKMVCKKKHN